MIIETYFVLYFYRLKRRNHCNCIRPSRSPIKMCNAKEQELSFIFFRHFILIAQLSLLCCMFIDQIHFIVLPNNSTGMMTYTVHIHVHPLRAINSCYTRRQRIQHLTFFFLWTVMVIFCLNVCWVVTVYSHLFNLKFGSEYTTVTVYHFQLVCCMFGV